MKTTVTESYEGVKVFAATKHMERDALGEKVSDWIRRSPGVDIVATTVTQSSDSEFHCLTIVVFYNLAPAASRA